MKRRKNNLKNFFQKIRFQYRVSVLNENTLEESWFIRLSRVNVFLYASLFILLTFFILASLIIYTPFKYYLPGYGGPDDRVIIINQSIQIDSLQQEVSLQATYLNMLKKIITGDIHPDSTLLTDTISMKERAEVFMEKSKEEQAFVERYEEEEKFNLSSLAYTPVENIYVFFKPVKGMITVPFNTQEKQFGVELLTDSNAAVVSVLAGTVIFSSFSFDFGWVIHVQHEDDYLSIYKNNSNILKKVGDVVKAGEVIAYTGSESNKKNGNQFYFELWRKGKPVNPEEVIIF